MRDMDSCRGRGRDGRYRAAIFWGRKEAIGPLVPAERWPQDSSRGGWQLAGAAGEAGSWPG